MAAEKLTRGRLAQIIVMLTLLVIAFFWRTLIYTPGLTIIDCDGVSGFCGTSHSQETIEFEWTITEKNIEFSLFSKDKQHSAYWEKEGKQALELSRSQEEQEDAYKTTWRWARQNAPKKSDVFNVVFDQYQYKFSYPKTK
ncbi:hypothetical protein [Salinivibrio sp. ES.052]|uniref:hypothetical protein n=1 Tax=Salinivibrio sp. ES.052 TaxID=1882823 RepID=UPI000925A200|nr:hypothetical protein [Salinivibrio sp. ES.052]SIN85923.1 hypothetical protein SAMN05444724_0910 [Salinivibrio sp. ES.052]